MTGCPGKELFGKKLKLEVGHDGALILDLNDFRDLSKVGSSAIGQSKKREEMIDEVKFKTNSYNGEDDFEAGDLKVTGFRKTIRAPEKAKVDGDNKEIEEEKHVKMEPFIPNLNNLSSFIVQVPSQSSKLKAEKKEKVSHLPPLPEESDLFQPSTGVTKGIQVIARELLLCLQNVDEGLVIELHHLAAELNVDVKKIFLVTNVLEAVGMVSRISINKIRWEGEGAKDQSLVQLHQLAIDENVLGQIHAAELEEDGGSVPQEGPVREDDKVKVTTGVVVQRVLMAFLAMPIIPPTMTTQTIAKVISRMGNAKCPQARLFELTNVLVGIGLLQKVQIGGRKSRCKSAIAYQYVGPRVEQVFMD